VSLLREEGPKALLGSNNDDMEKILKLPARTSYII
jgi:hypothetical protein